MPLVINQLTPADSARLVLDTLRSYWPSCHFRVSFSDDALTLHWMDGPKVGDVLAIADRFTPDGSASDWENSVILAHPDHNLEAVLPSFPEIKCRREVSAKTIMQIAQKLQNVGAVPSSKANEVRVLLQEADSEHPDARPAHSHLAALSDPLPVDTWQRESGIFDPLPEDLAIIALCDALRAWSKAPENFTQWETIHAAFGDAELQAVLVSALTDNRPAPGDMETLLDAVIADGLEAGDVETVAGADYIRDLLVPDDPHQGGLFGQPESGEATVLITMGRFLREVTGARL